MPSNSDPSTDVTFLFKGTIKEVKAATMAEVPVDKNTVVAMVDQVLEAPANLAKMGGHRVTIRLSGRTKVAVGDELIFHAHGWIFGPSIAVMSMKEERIRETRAHAALLSRGGDPVAHRQNRRIKHRFSNADVVISGRVTMIRIPPEATSASRAASMAADSAANTPEPIGPISEHTPHWREAHIEIDDVHKGEHNSSTVVIRFPASKDVRWYKAPKFEPGHQGFFMLRKHTAAKPKAAAPTKGRRKAAKKTAETTAQHFTALHPADFQPYTQPGGVRRIIESKAEEE